MYCLFCIVVLFVCKCVLLPPGDNPIAVNKYIIYRLTTTGARGLLLPSSGFVSLRRNELHFREEDGSTLLQLATSLEVNWLQPEATAVLEEAIKK